MAQKKKRQPVDDWTRVEEQEDWQSVEPQQPTPTPPPQPERSLVDQFNESWINRPLLSKETTGGVFDPKAAADFYDDPMQRREDEWRIPQSVNLPLPGGGTFGVKVPEWMGAGGSLKALGAGMLEGAGGVVESLTTPLNLATMGTGAVANRALKTATTLPSMSKYAYLGARKTADTARRATQALSVPVIGQGAVETYEGAKGGDWTRAGMGVATMAGGGAGLAMPRLPKGVAPDLPVRPPSVDMPVGVKDASGRPIAPPQTDMPARPAGPWNQNTAPGPTITPDMRRGLIARGFRDNEINVMTPVQAQEAMTLPEPTPITSPGRRTSAEPDFDPSTLNFVDPNTGELKTAAEAKPGDVAVTPDKSQQPPAQPAQRSLAPPPGLNFTDWLKNLASDERGSFDLDAFRSKETIERNRLAREQQEQAPVAGMPGSEVAPKPSAAVSPPEPNIGRRATEAAELDQLFSDLPPTVDQGYTDPDGLGGRMSNQEFAEFQRRQAAWGDPPPTEGDPSRYQAQDFSDINFSVRRSLDNMSLEDLRNIIEATEQGQHYQSPASRRHLEYARDSYSRRSRNETSQPQNATQNVDVLGLGSTRRVTADQVPRSYHDMEGYDDVRLQEFIDRFEGSPGYDSENGRNIINYARTILDDRQIAASRNGIELSEPHEAGTSSDAQIPRGPSRNEPIYTYPEEIHDASTYDLENFLQRTDVPESHPMLNYALGVLRERYARDPGRYAQAPDHVVNALDESGLAPLPNRPGMDEVFGAAGEVPDSGTVTPASFAGPTNPNVRRFGDNTSPPTAQQISTFGLDRIPFSSAPERIDYYANSRRPGMAAYIFNNVMVPILSQLEPAVIPGWISHYETSGAHPQIAEYLRNRQRQAGITTAQNAGTGPLNRSSNTFVNRLVDDFEEAARMYGGSRPTNAIRQRVTDQFRMEMANEGLTTPELDDIIRRAEDIARRNLGMSAAYNAQGMPVRQRKTLREVEEGKTVPPHRRLSAMIGREHAEDLISGKVKIDSTLSARGMDEPKMLDPDEVRRWNVDGDSWVNSYVGADPSKPGITIVSDPAGPNPSYDGRLVVHYRDANGLPIGYMSASDRGISMLATRSDLGMKRGKITWDILKEAFERGISKEDGGTSVLTQNFIQRIRYLVEKAQEQRAAAGRGGETGSINLKEIYDGINDMLKVGKKKLTNFWEDESGSVDPDRLKALFDQSQTRELTPDELNEARTLARAQQQPQETKQPSATRRMGGFDIGPTPGGELPVTPFSQRAREYMTGAPQDSTGPLVQGNQSPRATRLARGGGPQPTGRGPLLGADDIDQSLPVRERQAPEIEQPGMFEQIWNAPRSAQSIDLPGLTSAAFRQSRPLAFTTDWFKAWGAAVKAFGSKEALNQINQTIKDSKYMKPEYQAITGENGTVIRYDEKPSRAEKLGLQLSDILSPREEVISSSLVEKIPGYGRYARASNRAYQGFLNQLRYAKFEKMMDGAAAAGRDTDDVLGKKIADFANRATGRGGLGKLEPLAKELGWALYSPRALSARLQFMNPHNYTRMDPLVRQEYWKSLASIGASWAAFSFLASKIPGATVSLNPNDSDFGKVKFKNTRIDPGAGFQQLMVLSHRELPRKMGGGGTSSNGKFTEFGSTPMAATRLSLPGRYLYNQMNPSLRFVVDMLQATQKDPFDLTDRTLQNALPMYAEDIAQAAAGDATVADFFAPVLGSIGVGTNTYDKGNFNKPKITPAIKKATGVQLPTKKLTGF